MEFIPRMIHIDLTGLCNFNCLHCRGRSNANHLDKRELFKILDRLIELWGKNIEWFELGGGSHYYTLSYWRQLVK